MLDRGPRGDDRKRAKRANVPRVSYSCGASKELKAVSACGRTETQVFAASSRVTAITSWIASLRYKQASCGGAFFMRARIPPMTLPARVPSSNDKVEGNRGDAMRAQAAGQVFTFVRLSCGLNSKLFSSGD
jgi:hypothetical protein